MTEADKRKVLIVDDEQLARRRIKTLLENQTEKFEIREAEDGLTAYEMIKAQEPDIVFLDIQMPEFDGFDLIHSLENINFSIIFQTAYNEYAVKAFEVSACDYLLKPFSDERFEQSLNKIALKSNSPQIDRLTKHIKENRSKYMEQFSLKLGSMTKIVPVKDINYFFSKDHGTFVHFDQVNYSIDYSLNFLEERLSPDEFIRIHRNAIVNLSRIKQFTKGIGASVELSCGTVLKVSRERLKALQTVMTEQMI